MASTACFLHQISTLSSTARTYSQRSYAPFPRSSQIIFQAQKQNDAAVSPRLALTVLIGAATIGSKVSPADAAFGDSGVRQVSGGTSQAEGGFDSGAVATANILETSTPVIGGKQYYCLSVLTRTADGDEGGKHQLITASVSDGKLYIWKAQAGDKRWFKGARKFVEGTSSSFGLA